MQFSIVGSWIVAGALAMASPASGRRDPRTRLAPPERGHIPVAFVVTDGAVMIDFAGPWEVFQDVHVESRGTTMEAKMPFGLYTVSDTRKPIRISGGMQVVPDHTFDDAPPPRVVVVPAQSGASPKMLAWLRKMAAQSDVVMSVCTGAFKLGAAGLLDEESHDTPRLLRPVPARISARRGKEGHALRAE